MVTLPTAARRQTVGGLVVRTIDDLAEAVAFAPDGMRLVTAGEDGARGWALDLDDLTATAEDELTRGFTDAACREHLYLDSCR